MKKKLVSFGMAAMMAASLAAVSYTHLDVYKRQLSESRDKIILDKKSFAQHLYTLREALFCVPIKIYWMV